MLPQAPHNHPTQEGLCHPQNISLYEPHYLVIDSSQKILKNYGNSGITKSEHRIDLLKDWLASIHPSWADCFAQHVPHEPFNIILPSNFNNAPSFIEWHMLGIPHGDLVFLTFTPKLNSISNLNEGFPREHLENSSNIAAELYLKLQTAQERLASYLKNFPGVFYSQRPDLTFSYLAPRFEETLGQSPKAFFRSSNAFLATMLEADRLVFLKEIQKRAQSSETFTLTYRLRHIERGQALYIMDVRTPKLSSTGLLLGYEGVWVDITRQSIAEDRLAKSAWKESLAVLTGGLIHDFSNIMAGIYSISELYGASLDTEHSWFSGINQIKKSAREAQQMVRRIIDLSRESVGEASFYDLNKLITDQLDLLKIILPKYTEVEFFSSLSELPVYLDDVRFRQMLLNLAMNSRDALESIKGKVTIRTKHLPAGHPLFLNAFPEGLGYATREGAQIEFTDNGQGIEAAYLNKIFNPFFTTKESSKGSGLGLYNARLFIESIGGKYAVHSEIGKGTSFFFYIPLSDFSELESCATVPPSLAQPATRPRIAIYASQDPSEFSIVRTLREQSWELILFNDPQKLLFELGQSSLLIPGVLMIELGEDFALMDLISKIKKQYPEVKIALQTPRVTPEALAPLVRQHLDLVLDRDLRDPQVANYLQSLL